MTVTFGWVIWIVIFIWYILLFSIIKNEHAQEIGMVIDYIAGVAVLSIFSALLLYFKLRWDSNRLKTG
ncbi:MAG: hypothetical protein V3V14_03850 [Saprospiraceae bacterium]